MLSDAYISNSKTYGKSMSKAAKDVAGRILSRTLVGEFKDMYNSYKDLKTLYSIAKIYLDSDDMNHQSNGGSGVTVASMLKGGHYKPDDTLAVFTKTTMFSEREILSIPVNLQKSYYTTDFYNKDKECVGSMHFNDDNAIKEIVNDYSSFKSTKEYTEKPFEINHDNITNRDERYNLVNE